MSNMPVIDLHTCIQGEGKYAGIPHILVRMGGCNLLCGFRDNICDTPYSSWFPEKARFTFQEIETLVMSNPQIKHSFITGGEPFLYPKEVKQIILLLKQYGHFVAAETNGTLYENLGFDFITISPKLSNSVPVAGKTITDNQGKLVEISEKQVVKHNKGRLKPENLLKLIKHYDYQVKFVVQEEEDIGEIQDFVVHFNIPASKVYLMPEGISNEQLGRKRTWLIGKCIETGYNYTDRLHIIAYGNKREA